MLHGHKLGAWIHCVVFFLQMRMVNRRKRTDVKYDAISATVVVSSVATFSRALLSTPQQKRSPRYFHTCKIVKYRMALATINECFTAATDGFAQAARTVSRRASALEEWRSSPAVKFDCIPKSAAKNLS